VPEPEQLPAKLLGNRDVVCTGQVLSRGSQVSSFAVMRSKYNPAGGRAYISDPGAENVQTFKLCVDATLRQLASPSPAKSMTGRGLWLLGHGEKALRAALDIR
jgi:hypothetical protein